jgi:elongation factor 2
MGTCTNTITRRRGRIRSTETKGQLTTITGYMPVAETLGLSDELRFATSGHAIWQCTFDHWEKLPEGIADKTVAEIRIKKGLPSEVPEPEKFVDEIKKRRT